MKKVSIQLTLGGHSFSTTDLDAGAERIYIELLTPRSMLVPQELFTADAAAALLSANGMACAEGECPVWSDPEQPIVGLMAFPVAGINAAREQLGSAAIFTTPLLRKSKLDYPTLWLYAVSGLLYIKIYVPTLRFAEVVSAMDKDDLSYYAELLNRRFTLENFRIQIEGDNTKCLKSVFGKYSRQIQ